MKLYAVVVLNSGEAVMDTDVLVGVFDTYDEAKKAFENEKEGIKSFVYDVDVDNEEDWEQNIEVREDSENRFAIYDDNRAFASIVAIHEIKPGKIISETF